MAATHYIKLPEHKTGEVANIGCPPSLFGADSVRVLPNLPTQKINNQSAGESITIGRNKAIIAVATETEGVKGWIVVVDVIETGSAIIGGGDSVNDTVGFYGNSGVSKTNAVELPVAGFDPASTQTLVNAIRDLLHQLNLGNGTI